MAGRGDNHVDDQDRGGPYRGRDGPRPHRRQQADGTDQNERQQTPSGQAVLRILARRNSSTSNAGRVPVVDVRRSRASRIR